MMGVRDRIPGCRSRFDPLTLSNWKLGTHAVCTLWVGLCPSPQCRNRVVSRGGPVHRVPCSFALTQARQGADGAVNCYIIVTGMSYRSVRSYVSAPPEPDPGAGHPRPPRANSCKYTAHTDPRPHRGHDGHETGTQTLDTRQRVTGGVSTIFHSIQYTRTK